MSIENIISSLQDCKIALCIFAGSMKTYSYKVRKDWDVADGDVLVVDATSSGLTIVQVVKVVEGEIDITADFNYTWAVCKVDLAAYTEQLTKEAEVAVELKALRRKAQQKKALADLLGDLGDEANEVIERVRSRL